MKTILSKEKELENEKFSCLIRHLRSNTTTRHRILAKWKITKGIKYVKMVQTEIDSYRHIKKAVK